MSSLLFTLAVEASIRAAILVAAMALILTLFRIRSSGTRHAAWATVLAVMLLMPVLTRVVPAIRVSIPDRAVPLVPFPPVRQIDTPLPALPASMTSGQSRAMALPDATPELKLQNDTTAPPVAPFRWDVAGIVGYLAVTAFFLVRFVIGLLQVARIRRHSQPVTTTTGQVVWESTRVATPVTIGLVAPRVIVPAAWREWPPEMLTAVLAHERAHCTRRDPLIATLARLNTTLFWFHPLAWWLERKVATLAEHACDEAALTQVTRRQYAETLLDIATTARRHNGRLVWQGVGVDGDGQFGQRIDRVLSGQSWPRASRARRTMVAAACAVAIAIAVACQQEAKVEPLREDPELAAELKANAAQSASYQATTQMTAAEADALEKTLAQNPEDMATREKLLNFYQWTGKNTQSWNDNVAARRRHAIWLVEHHPEIEPYRTRVTKATDPVGYAQLRERWLSSIAAPDTDDQILNNAARFFAGSDYPMAERIILRGKASQPPGSPEERRWAARLGNLYATAMRGGGPNTWATREHAENVAWARARLERASDPTVLLVAGGASGWSHPDQREFLDQLVVRVSQMEGPVAEEAREELRQRAAGGEHNAAFMRAPRSEWPAMLAKSTGVTKLRQLAVLAETEYMGAEYRDWTTTEAATKTQWGSQASKNVETDKRDAAEKFAQSKAYAKEAIDLGKTLPPDADVSSALLKAHLAYGLNVFRDGNREEAVRQLQQAAEVQNPDPYIWPFLEYRLMDGLLKHGERASVIEYLERAAQSRRPQVKEQMLKDAAAIRKGIMPANYQRRLADRNL